MGEKIKAIESIMEEAMQIFGGNPVATIILRDLDDAERGIILTTDAFEEIAAFIQKKGFRQ